MNSKRVVLGISGGIAAYKAADLCSKLRKAGYEVRVVMTENACKFIAPLTLETLSGNAVAVNDFEHTFEIGHISLAKWADAFVIAPATANVIAKLACGIADDLLSSTSLAMQCPILIAPAMNSAMWLNAATQQNIATLKARGFHFVGPESGFLACGDTNIGRMSEPADILMHVEKLFAPKDLSGKTIMVTAGPTHEAIDPVRYIANRSSGKMGYAIAEAAAERGADVILVSGPVRLAAPKNCKVIGVVSTRDLYDAVTTNAQNCDCIIQAAAPADFRPDTIAEQKIKRTGDSLSLNLIPNPDIAQELGRRKHSGQVLVAFAAETNNVIENAQGKLIKKNADLIVCNDVTKPGAGFDTDTNIITIISRDHIDEYPLLSKREAADKILDSVVRIWNK